MIVRRLQDLKAEGKTVMVCDGQCEAVRPVTKADNMGFSVSEGILKPGMDQILHYKNHVEANVIVEGEGTLEDLATGEVHEIGPGTVYLVFPADRHRLKTKTGIRLFSVFNPPLVGDEVHAADGSYPSPPKD